MQSALLRDRVTPHQHSCLSRTSVDQVWEGNFPEKEGKGLARWAVDKVWEGSFPEKEGRRLARCVHRGD